MLVDDDGTPHAASLLLPLTPSENVMDDTDNKVIARVV